MKTKLLILTLLFFSVLQIGCKKGELESLNEAEFCAFIISEDYDQTGLIIDKFLSGLDISLSDEEKMKRLEEWLKCKGCVDNAEIICISCIKTNPPQSEIIVWFNVNGQSKEKFLDILMGNPLTFRIFHD